MSIISIQRDTNNTISIVRMQVSDTLATVSMTDYIKNNQTAINNLNGGVWAWFITDMILVASSDGNAFYEFVDTNFDTIVIFGQVGTGTVNPGLQNNLPYYAANGNTLSPLSNLANAILATNGSSVPALTHTLPTAVQANITQLGTIGTGVWNGTPVTVPFGGTGNATFTAYSVICGGTTSTGNLQNVSGLGTAGQILTSNGAGALPTWQANAASGTVDVGTVNALAYYPAATAEVHPINTIASSVLITSGFGVPTWVSQLPLTLGGTAASLVASNGGIVYSTSTSLAILAGTGTARQLLLSGAASTPAWSTTTFPATTNINEILFSSANNVITGITAGNFGVLISSSSGVPSWLANGTTGQILTATTSGTPSWAAPAASSVTFTGNTGTPFSGNAVTISGGTTGLTFNASTPSLTMTGTLILANGGTSASLTASNGGIVYSTASAMAILAGTATANQILMSGTSSAPSWSTATYPATAGTSGNVITSNGTNFSSATLTSVIDAALGSAQGDILYRNSTVWTVLAPGTSGQFLQTQGAAANPQWATGSSGFTTINIQKFTTNGTYTPTANMKYCIIECLGGGGGGGGTASAVSIASAGGGGGAGSYSRKASSAASIGVSQTVTVGAAGSAGTAGNNAGGNGGDTSVGVLCVGKGGTGGSGQPSGSGNVVPGGAGGIAGTGDFTPTGATGQNGGSSSSAALEANDLISGAGASSLWGGGGLVNVSRGTGGAATNYGSGGAGGTVFNSGSSAGGAGSAGVVIITEYI